MSIYLVDLKLLFCRAVERNSDSDFSCLSGLVSSLLRCYIMKLSVCIFINHNEMILFRRKCLRL